MTVANKKTVRTSAIDTATGLLTEAGLDLTKELTSFDDAQLGYSVPQSSGAFSTVMSVHQVAEHVEWLTLHPEFSDVTPLYLGPSGVGKTYAIRAGAQRAADKMGRKLELVEKHVSLMGPTDLAGIPRPETRVVDFNGQMTEVQTKRTEFFPPHDLPMASAFPEHVAAFWRHQEYYTRYGQINRDIMRDHPLHVLFLDEFTNPSMPAVIQQCYPIIYGKQIAGMPLLPDTQVILAGNRPQDGTNSIALPRSATLRVNMIEVVPSLTGWFQHWALQTQEIPVAWGTDENGNVIVTETELRPRIHPTVIAYLNQNSGRFAPDLKGTPTMQPAESPRTWNSVARAMYAFENPMPGMQVDEKMMQNTIAGYIGQAGMLNFEAFRKFSSQLPDVRKLLNSPGVARPEDVREPIDGKKRPDWVQYGWMPEKWPTGIEIQITMTTQMVPLLKRENARRFMRLLLDGHITPDVGAMAMKLLRPMGIVTQLTHDWAMDEFSEWAAKYRHLMF